MTSLSRNVRGAIPLLGLVVWTTALSCSRTAPAPAPTGPAGPRGAVTSGLESELAPTAKPQPRPSAQVRAVRARPTATRSPTATLYRPAEAIARITGIVAEITATSEALVVWLVDVSPSGMRWGTSLHEALRAWYTDADQGAPRIPNQRLRTAVVTIGQAPQIALEPTPDPDSVVRALDGLRMDSSGHEMTFAALRLALERFLPERTHQRRELRLVVLTDEAGDDWPQVDTFIAEPAKWGVSVSVLGVPAPFGRTRASDPAIESDAAGGDLPATGILVQGPESRALERVSLPLLRDALELDLIDSGFGPFGLQWLCNATGGEFLAVRATSQGATFTARRQDWPSPSTRRFAPEVMARYAPDYTDAAGYQHLFDTSQARRALHQAAQLPEPLVLRNPQRNFVKRSEADLKNQLDRAQQAAAKAAPAIDQMCERLREGLADRDQLPPRWQAAFDLAFGRVCAAKVRADGYNAMLAALKRGRPFQNPSSRGWLLEPADTLEASSTLEKLLQRARTHLQQVVRNHPQTPWSAIAEQELQQPLGWEWVETE